MTIAFATVALNIHQVSIADELYRLANGKFWFIETHAPNKGNDKGGNTDFSKRPYLIKAYESAENYRKGMQIVRDADVFIYGSCPIAYFKERVKTGKLTFLYSERWLKRGWVNLFSPRLVKQMLFYHTHCHGKPVYLLSSGGYAAQDFHKMLAFKNKSYKWGYFTAVPDLDIESVIQAKRGSVTKILWVARFLGWKHPEVMLRLASQLRERGISFTLNMIGTGPEYDRMAARVEQEGLGSCVHLLGNMPNGKVLEAMRSHDIFCLTSDKNEGWGAVVNEAMSNGCCPVVSMDTGAAPYLIEEGKNGFTFNLSKPNDLFDKVYWLMQHPEKREEMSIAAYRTIRNVWSPANAASNFYLLAESLLADKPVPIGNGPCSVAE